MNNQMTRDVLLHMDNYTLYNAVIASPVFHNVAMNDPVLAQRFHHERVRRRRLDHHIQNHVPM